MNKTQEQLPDGVKITNRVTRKGAGYSAYKKGFEDAMAEAISSVESAWRTAFIVRKKVNISVITPGEGTIGRRKAVDRQEIEHLKPYILYVDLASTTAEYIRKLERKGWPIAWTNLTKAHVPAKDERLNDLWALISGLETAKQSQELTQKYMNTAQEKYLAKASNGKL